jgi:hypothetical protein
MTTANSVHPHFRRIPEIAVRSNWAAIGNRQPASLSSSLSSAARVNLNTPMTRSLLNQLRDHCWLYAESHSYPPPLYSWSHAPRQHATRSLPRGAILNGPNIDRCQRHHWSPLANLPSADGGGRVGCRMATACRPSLRDHDW